MSTPTREQECKHKHIKTWVFEDTKEPAMWSCADCGLKFAPEMATLTAGRDQGLREAKEVCEGNAKRWPGLSMSSSYVVNECAAAIEQLRASA